MLSGGGVAGGGPGRAEDGGGAPHAGAPPLGLPPGAAGRVRTLLSLHHVPALRLLLPPAAPLMN